MGLLLNSGDSCFRHKDEAAAKFHAGKEFSLPEQIGREFVKMTGQSTGPGVAITSMWGRGGDTTEAKTAVFYLMASSIPTKSLHNPLSLSPTPPPDLQSTKEWFYWEGWNHFPVSYGWILEQLKIFFTTFISTLILNKAELKLREF